MSGNKTIVTEQAVADFLAGVDPQRRRDDGLELDRIFQSETGWKPRMWGPTIVGYGEYHYVYASGREGDSLATGFSPRKANLSIYIMPGYQDLSDELSRLGKHKMGKSCLYVNKLADIDQAVLREIISKGLLQLGKSWAVKPS